MTRIFTCDCDVVLSGEGTESLIEPVHCHFGEAQPEFELTVANGLNCLQSEDRSTGPTEPLADIGDIEIRPIATGSGPDVIRFFDVDAAFHGSLDMFLGAGFEITSEDPLVVRRRLP